MVQRVNITQVRPRLSELIAMAEHGGEEIIIARHGKAVAALVSMADLNRIWRDRDGETYGFRNPEIGIVGVINPFRMKARTMVEERKRLYEEHRAKWEKRLAQERKLAEDLAEAELEQKARKWWAGEISPWWRPSPKDKGTDRAGSDTTQAGDPPEYPPKDG